MDLYSFIIQNKETFKIIYAILIIAICFFIVLRTNRLFGLSSHPGIRYFRNAFFFFGLAFFSRYILAPITKFEIIFIYLFEFFIIMAGFFLLYSLLWRKIDRDKEIYSSLANSRILIFYLLALIIVVIQIIWNTNLLMFLSQILLFFFASIISFNKFKNNKKSKKFPAFYFIAMVLMLAAWILNFFAVAVYSWNYATVINIYFFNTIFFLVFLFGVLKITKV